MRFSIIIPMKNEAGNAASLIAEIEASCAAIGPFELIVVDDGSTDATRATLTGLAATRPWMRVLAHDRSAGQSAAVHSGVRAATAPVVCTLDGDGQNPPDQLPLILAPLLARDGATGPALVAGQRKGRKDTWSKKLASLAANRIRSFILKDGTRDTGCGLKAFRRDAFLALPYFNHMHRYLPALFARDGGSIALVDVTHRARGEGRSNYSNFGRAVVGLYDLVGVAWLLRRRKTAQPSEITIERGAF
jgi:dolichol-phosphate mannosyltransferase